MLSRALPLPASAWRTDLQRCVKPAYLEANLAAFDFGASL